MERIILHCDCNCFYASVELLSHPALRDVPVAVCGDPKSRHGIILAKNELAKQAGVRTAETIWQAKRKCPSLHFLPPHHGQYAEYSQKINAIYAQYTDLVEPFGIDESWLDITGTCHLFGGDPKQVADDIRHRVQKELGLTISVGVSFNKIFAKLGSDYKKPNATTVISRENWKEIVFPLPVGDLLFVGTAARKTLHRFGIKTIGQLAGADVNLLETHMGKMGHQLHTYANGKDTAPVRSLQDREPVKSVGNGSTFPQNLTTESDIRRGILLLSDSVAMRLRKYGFYAGGVHVALKRADFKVFSRQKQLTSPTHLCRELTEEAIALALKLWTPPTPIRAITVTAIQLTSERSAFEQVNLFAQTNSSKREQQEKLEHTMDQIRNKYGRSAIRFGTTIHQHKEE